MPTRARLKLLKSLSRRSARAAEGRYVIEGVRLVIEALASGAPIEEVLLAEDLAASPAGRDLADRAGEAGIATEIVAAREIDRIAGTRTPQGVVAVIRHEEPDPAALAGPGLVLVLDAVADPGNVGTLIRAADAFGARAVVAGPGTADFENDKVLRAAMGSTFHVALVREPDPVARLRREREGGLEVWAAVLDGDDLDEVRPRSDRLALVLGSEAHGVSPALAAEADRRVTVRCPGRAESLNVAMAGAVILSRLTKLAGAVPG
jgi:TrmH family RNA methyltransferase